MIHGEAGVEEEEGERRWEGSVADECLGGPYFELRFGS
jgi:hypothetical protein